MSDLAVTYDGPVAILEIQRPPNNFFDMALIREIADMLEHIDQDAKLRSVVLASRGKAFCAGADFSPPDSAKQRNGDGGKHLYLEALRIFSSRKPIVAAIQGPAIGGGLGLALAADFRITCPEARFAANFTRLGFHPGFGLTVTLPRLIGINRAELLFYTSRRIDGKEAVEIGLANELVPLEQVRTRAIDLAREIAECSPLGVIATRATMRSGLVEGVRAATEHELHEQMWLKQTQDFAEGVKSSAERRPASFVGK